MQSLAIFISQRQCKSSVTSLLEWEVSFQPGPMWGAAHCGKSPPVLDSEAWRSQLNLSLEAVGKSEKPSARHLACEPQPWQAMEVAAERNMPTLAGPDTAALLSDSSQECLGQSKARGSPGASVVEHCFGFSMADYFPFLSKPWSTLGL
ncbi:unnamed protein product [Caretta caretta]